MRVSVNLSPRSSPVGVGPLDWLVPPFSDESFSAEIKFNGYYNRIIFAHAAISTEGHDSL